MFLGLLRVLFLAVLQFHVTVDNLLFSFLQDSQTVKTVKRKQETGKMKAFVQEQKDMHELTTAELGLLRGELNKPIRAYWNI